MSPAERAAAFRHREPRIPTRFIVILTAAAAGLAVGGLLLEHLVSALGLNPTAASSATAAQSSASASVANASPPTSVVAPPSAAPGTHELSASLPALMGLAKLSGERAPGFSLLDAAGRTLSLASEAGDAVVLTFFNAPCQDICPVLARELEQADVDLGPEAAHVAFLTVNTDPLALSVANGSTAATRTGLIDLANWHFLTGGITTLSPVWKAYGVTVEVDPVTGMVAHNDVMYFIDRAGHLRYRASPFADETSAGVDTLSPTTVTRWADGIATYVRGVLAPPS